MTRDSLTGPPSYSGCRPRRRRPRFLCGEDGEVDASVVSGVVGRAEEEDNDEDKVLDGGDRLLLRGRRTAAGRDVGRRRREKEGTRPPRMGG